MSSFQSGPDTSVPNARSETKNGSPKTDAAALKEFFAAAVKDLAVMRSFISEIRRASEQAARQKLLLGLSGQIGLLKRKSDLPELLPVWQMAFAFEGLLNQLTRKAAEVTASTLLTADNAVNLLELLCKPGLKPDLASNPPVRLLAVDDDLISRKAISAALKKVFDQPDLSPDGKEALALLASKTYDVVFLDVEMPGMDGFELCTRIHGSAGNQNTPVVFVTSHSDFDSRAKSMSVGGNELIAKPFLAFEITLKALTLVLRARLQNTATEAPSRNTEFTEPSVVKTAPLASEACAALSAAARPAPFSPESEERPVEKPEKQKERDSQPGAEKSSRPNPPSSTSQPLGPSSALPDSGRQSSNGHVSASPEPSRKDFAQAFFLNAPADLAQLRNHLNAASKTAEPAELQESLGLLYIGVHSLAADAEQARLQAIVRVVSGLEGMLKKLLEKPKLCAPSAMDSAAAALDLIEELCRTRSNPDLANPPARIMVVDDDPIARRAISVSLQLTFGKPDSVENGEAAVALAAETPFDLIFLDIRMPGMDGFAACSKIHEKALNTDTPVIFVSSQDDKDARSQAASSGGSGFIPKPILSSQIALVALTSILRRRMSKKSLGIETCSLAASC